MADQSNILREYLIALGFKVDEVQGKRFDNSLTNWDKKATKLSRSLVGVGVAAQVMVTEFAFRMEKMYYSSKLAESTAENLSALNFGGKNIGIANMAGQVEKLAGSLRANPGLVGLLHSLGVKVEGRDKADVLTDLIAQTKKMPFYIAQRYASMFGISPDDLLLMQQGLSKMQEAAALRKQTALDLGVDTNKAAESAVEYANAWREIGMVVGLAKDALIIEFLPAMRELASVTKLLLGDWVRIIQTPREQLVNDLRAAAGLDPMPKAGVKLTPEAQARVDQGETAKALATQPKPQGPYGKSPLDMTPQERTTLGLPEDAKDLKWEDLSDEDRKRAGYDKPTTWINNALQYWGLKKRPGVELSGDAKKRIGLPQSKSTVDEGSKTLLERGVDKLYGAMGHPQFKNRTPDPASIEAVTAPDRVQIAREQAAADALRAAQTPQPPAPTATDSDPARTPERQSLMQQLEVKYALAPGMLDRMWKKESNRGRAMLSPKGAQGHFQFMPATQKEFGLKDPNDFKESAEATARKMAGLMKRYGGNEQLAAAAFNWGEGNVKKALQKAMEDQPNMSQMELDRYVLGVMPKETRDYVANVAPNADSGNKVEVTQHNTYNITEAGDAKQVAEEIVAKQRDANADTIRQFSQRIQ